MRKRLSPRRNRALRYRASFERYSAFHPYTRENQEMTTKTLLFTDITSISGRHVTDHLWFSSSRQLEALRLLPGDLVEFEARPIRYRRGNPRYARDRPPRYDYHLSSPRRLRKVTSWED